MTPEQIDRVFGRGRLKMVTGEHVEVFREAVLPGERRRYTKRFLNTRQGDFGQWTEREWRILARLIGHGIACVPEVVQYDRGRQGGQQLVQTYDAGVTVDQWATLLPVTRDGRVHRHVFEDCAHWWALAHHCLVALNAIHSLELVHLDVKGDNVCIPYAPSSFDPNSDELRLRPIFAELALIDFAFALISRESLTTPLPIGWQRDYDYQSPRLLSALEAGRNGDLQATRELDWRCDMYSLAAMLKRYLPDEGHVVEPELATGWSGERYDAAKALILRLRECHDGELPRERPHKELIATTGTRLAESELAHSLERGWMLAREATVAPAMRLTPVTLLAPALRVVRSGRVTAVTVVRDPRAASPPLHAVPPTAVARTAIAPPRQSARLPRRPIALATLVAVVATGAAVAYLAERMRPLERYASDRDFDAQRDFAPQRDAAAQRDDAAPREAAPQREAEPQREVAAQRDAATRAHPAPAVASPERPTHNEPAVAGTNRELAPIELEATPSPVVPPSPPSTAAVATSETPAQSAPAQEKPASGAPKLPSRLVRTPAIPSQPAPAMRTTQQTPAQSAPPAQAATAVTAPAAPKRPLPAWVSLEPPGWLRTGKAPTPPGATAAARAQSAPSAHVEPSSAATKALPVDLATAARAEATSAQRTDATAASVPPADTTSHALPPTATPIAAETTPPVSNPVPATLPPATAATPSEPRKTSPVAALKRWLLGLSQPPAPAAPIEDRSESRRLAQADVGRAQADAPRAQTRASDAEPPRSPNPPAYSDSAKLPRTSEFEPVRPPTRSESFDPPPPPPADYATHGRRTVAETVPRVASRAEGEVSRVLSLAASAYSPTQDRLVADAARATRIADVDNVLDARAAAPIEARRLNDEARAAMGSRRNVSEAYRLQLQAFGANPRDPEVAGNLALYHLWLTPPQPEKARQLALFALTARNPQFHTTRMEDWTTYAIASALTGREADATRALYVTLALSANIERRCVAALDALASYGERLRAPVEAMFARVRAQGRGVDSPACSWPATWTVRRLP